ncbi:MAG: NYN domain-containing protein [Candidatus Methanoperedens sp.]|nr:NYN domain-containing protein [Candidatus Methanoperedens sp.]MCZ7369286.1 NYN domain-containing protein [Candidatus Methanoperedens sp.]
MELVRVYYYDAIVDFRDDSEKHQEQESYFKRIQKINNYEVKLGRLIKTGKNNNDYRQKGVDVLLAIDMISKAHLDHYDIALLLAGDDDYLDMVKSIKDFTGRRVYGAYFENSASKRLVEFFDMRIPMTDDMI